MATITTISRDFASDAFGQLRKIGEDVPIVEKQVAVKNGVAAVPPSCIDFDIFRSLLTPEWVALPGIATNAADLLESLSECNPPTLQARWTLNQALRDIRAAADDLEREIVHGGLWMSEDEWINCDSMIAPILWFEDHRKAG